MKSNFLVILGRAVNIGNAVARNSTTMDTSELNEYFFDDNRNITNPVHLYPYGEEVRVEDESTYRFFVCQNFIYSHELKRVIALKDTYRSFMLISEEIFNGTWNHIKGMSSLAEYLKESNYFRDFHRADLYKIFVPNSIFSGMVGKIVPKINSPEDIQELGEKLMRGEATDAEFSLTYLDQQ